MSVMSCKVGKFTLFAGKFCDFVRFNELMSWWRMSLETVIRVLLL